mmetsp:Transcript_5421/g.15726  ORF Transcript_5421/g.15726 Transcript_5421/m.15726 type:complete len:305 (+) Transcript_5421:187-1101(+)
MRTQSASTKAFSLALCLVSTVLVEAQNNYNNYYDASNQYNGFSVCSDTVIEVTDVQMYCDSPGTFYYGSGKYRNSENCTAGDKGKFLIDFYINDPDTIEAVGAPILDINAFGNIGWYERNQEIVQDADLCSLSSLKSLSGSVCPAEGKYRIQSNFYWDEESSNQYGYNPVFYPTISVGIKSSIYQNTYDYGGANTKYCSGTTFLTSWTNNVKKVYANSISNFFKSFGILIFTICVMGSFIWFMVKRRPRTFEYAVPEREDRKEIALPTIEESSFGEPSYSGSDSEKFDFNKMKSPTANQSFLDF